MTKPIVIIVAIFVILLSTNPTHAQLSTNTPRIGILHPGFPAKSTAYHAFIKGLRDLGYVEDKNITIIRRFAKGQRDRLPAMADDLVRRNVDIMVVCCQPAADAARKATSTIPIVVWVAANYVNQGLVKSLRRPGGNLTGLSSISSDYIGKQLQLFKETIAGLSRVAVLWHTAHRSHPFNVKLARAAARRLDLEVLPIGVKNANGFADAFDRIKREKVDGVLVLRGSVFNRNRKRVTKLANEIPVPSMFGHRQEAEAGGLLAYGPDVADLGRRAATYVDKILKGANPTEMPIEQPIKYDLAVNLKTAKALDLTFPASILLQATQVIE
jgi:putative ABC transport system substrate-binding protein